MSSITFSTANIMRGVRARMRKKASYRRTPLLENGQPVLLHLDLGPRESYDAWLSFLQDLVGRGLRDPLLVVMDGAPGAVSLSCATMRFRDRMLIGSTIAVSRNH
jgi:transposase-like protein